jgi:hypothetical protein
VVVRPILRWMSLEIGVCGSLALTHRQEEVTVRSESDPTAVVAAAPRVGLEELLELHEPIVQETSSDKGRGRLLNALDRLRKAEVEKSVGGEFGVRHDVEEPALPLGDHLGDARDRVRQELAVAYDPEATRTFGHQHVSVREEGDGPWDLESVGDGDHPEVMKRGWVDS